MIVKKVNQTSVALALNGSVVVASPKGLKLNGSKPLPAAKVLALFSKGTRRKFRKALRIAGFPAHAGAKVSFGFPS